MTVQKSPTIQPWHQSVGESRGYVLLIEENYDIRLAMRNALTQGGFGVIEATNNTEAIEAIHYGNNPLLVEVVLVNTNNSKNRETLDYFNKQFPSIALIGLTGPPSSKTETTEHLNIAILGAGRGGSALLEILRRLPRIDILGIADKDPQAPALGKAKELGIPIAAHIPTLILNREVHLIVDVTGDATMQDLIGKHKPFHTEILGGTAAKLLWDVVQYEAEMYDQLIQTSNLAALVREGVLADYLVEPVETEKLVRSVAKAIEKRKVHET